MVIDWIEPTATDEKHDAITGRIALLLALLNTDIPQHVDRKMVLETLATQRGLAKLDCRKFSVEPVSLNTLKKRAEGHDRTWGDLDRMRIMVVDRLRTAPQPEQVPSRRTIPWYAQRIATLEEKVAELHEDLVVMTRAFDKAFFSARSLARDSGNARLQQLCAQREEEIRLELSYLRIPKLTKHAT